MAKADLTAARLRELLNYNPDTGRFVWLVTKARQANAGDAAGSPNHGYIAIGCDGDLRFAHRLAWLYMHGVWPTGRIDHINGDKTDNRICNLREVSHSVNLQNQRRAMKNNKLGLLGVRAYAGKFRAQIKANGQNIHLGYYLTPEAAHSAYIEAKRRLHTGCTL
jgi:HNH endonuclease